jgi:hypothetical protein
MNWKLKAGFMIVCFCGLARLKNKFSKYDIEIISNAFLVLFGKSQ